MPLNEKSKEATMTFDEKLNKILKHCDMINPLLIPLVRNQITQAIAEELPKRLTVRNAMGMEEGFNHCLSEVRKRLGIK